ncbi:hypothetical protein LKL81_14870 [Bacillus paranthracis]|uniref:hypothetical protein n=1 Tax=Bacillus paranthracis TaxID=2026186 RepID=UPI00147B7A75|nr:hypothetical protein [Bacillus paranthracis]MCC2428499.1 hypothetical protein [Bacillus paranthracis]WAI29034.1 MAG: hypothetical protein NRZ50_12070 [Bacillus paranthracis]WAI33157.1 MAG: hypothetical protein NRZ52_02995 [Bacillus paranthracis]WAI38708.1 MAG: hypothetical protein NRZ51_01350 [Bacillus paranthracis]HDR4704343.1 hypothetical protein [Bacillus paranthracis]
MRKLKKEEMNFSRSQQELGNMIIPSVEETKWNQLIEILGLIVIENIELKDSTN